MLIKAMVLILLAAFAGLFFIKGPGGEPILSLEDLKPKVPEVEAVSTPTKVYRWQDENGVWQFSNKPVDEAQGELVEFDGNINTIPAVDTSILKSSEPTTQPSLAVPAGLTTVPSGQVEEMMETVNNLQQTVDERKAKTLPTGG